MNLLFLLRNSFNSHIELNLVRDVKNHKKGFYKYTGQKTQSKENTPSLTNVKRTGYNRYGEDRYSTSSLPWSSLGVRFPISLITLNCQAGAGRAKSLSL